MMSFVRHLDPNPCLDSWIPVTYEEAEVTMIEEETKENIIRISNLVQRHQKHMKLDAWANLFVTKLNEIHPNLAQVSKFQLVCTNREFE